jgi:hypothetical protein
VIDDTDHFAASGAGGKLDEQAIANLYHHGVRTLAEFDRLDVLVAIQPQFRQVEPVGEVETRFNFRHIDVATLPSGHDDLGLSHVLARRLAHAHVEASVDDLIEPSALAQLQGAYFIVDHDLRRVLQFADEAARLAVDDGATRIAPRHVSAGTRRSLSPDRMTADIGRANPTTCSPSSPSYATAPSSDRRQRRSTRPNCSAQFATRVRLQTAGPHRADEAIRAGNLHVAVLVTASFGSGCR